MTAADQVQSVPRTPARTSHDPARSRVTTAASIVLILLALAAIGLRFWRLDASPPGFFSDEAAVSAHVLCLKQTGRNLFGAEWPLVSRVLGRGYSSLAYQVPAITWTYAAGDSIAGMRSFAALSGTLLVLGVLFLGWSATGDFRIGAWSALAMAVSPWAFQFSRLAWDPAISPVYLTWGLAFLFLALRPGPARGWTHWISITLAAGLLAASMLSYAPQRVQVPIVLLCLAWWKRADLRQRRLDVLAFVVLLAAFTAPVVLKTVSGEIQGRFEYLSVFSEAFWVERGFSPALRIPLGLLLFARNVLMHFSPMYLLVSGDANLRHSTQAAGIWSWLDAAALGTFVLLAAVRKSRGDAWMFFLLVAYVAGLFPASLTWESVPHASRSFAAAPFLALLVGTAIERVRAAWPHRRELVTAAAAIIVLLFGATFVRDYFWHYPARAASAFDKPVVDVLQRHETGGHPLSEAVAPKYPRMALRFYQIRSGETCTPVQ